MLEMKKELLVFFPTVSSFPRPCFLSEPAKLLQNEIPWFIFQICSGRHFALFCYYLIFSWAGDSGTEAIKLLSYKLTSEQRSSIHCHFLIFYSFKNVS